MKKTVVGVALMTVAALGLAQSAGDRLGDALRAPLPGARKPDSRLPIYLKAGSLICERWQGMTRVAEEAARADDSRQATILRDAGCAIVPEDVGVTLVDIDPKSWEGAALRTYGLTKVWWQESSGINDVGYVGTAALRN